jgi:hypothetical protein
MGGDNEFGVEISPPYTRAHAGETDVGDMQRVKGCGYVCLRRWTDV